MTKFADAHDPVYAVPEQNLTPVDNYLSQSAAIPASRMFLIKKNLKIFSQDHPGEEVYDASHGDGGASLPGVPDEILAAAAEMQIKNGTAYDMPYGTDLFRKTVIEDYWHLDPQLGYGPANVLAGVGGRDVLVKAYQAMLSLGYGRQGDAIIVSRVPWISYTWGPYGIGANVMYAPGSPEDGWMYSEASIRSCVEFANRTERKIACLVITCPENPTGLTISPHRQVALAKAALEAGVAFVLFDWMYHYVTDGEPMDLNSFLGYFEPAERERLLFLDGITKSLGGSNIRNCHLIAAENVIKFIVARASHSVIPPFYSQAVAITAYQRGYAKSSRTIVEPTNASRSVLKAFLDHKDYQYILGKGYYAFINVDEAIAAHHWADSEPLGQYLAERHGIAVVPGMFFSKYGGQWIRFSYATPPERTQEALVRLARGLKSND